MRILNEYESEVEDPITKEKNPKIAQAKKVLCYIVVDGIDSSSLIWCAR
mgnify:CR=1 FL=1|tara:strand:+ start:304 stop:450 length:147 start_codon:yes stop_codon:yes gene_type:complete